MANQSKQFIDLLYGDLLRDDRQLLLWTLPDQKSAFFVSSDGASEYAASRAAECDVYFGLSLLNADLGPTRRGALKEEVHVAIPGFWADFDFKSDNKDIHKKENLPVDGKDVWRIIDGAGPKPSVLVNSGHGVQAYWLFQEPWEFDSHDERLVAQQMERAWLATLNGVAHSLGFELDAAWDIARIFRLPGTLNRKAEPVNVTIIEDGGPRYCYDDFEPYFSDESRAAIDDDLVRVGDLSLNPHVNPEQTCPEFAFSILYDIKFRKTWLYQRADLGDNSPSAYDIAMAHVLVQKEWTDQQIADVIIAMRRKHGTNPDKSLRPNYLALTIGRAKKHYEDEKGAPNEKPARKMAPAESPAPSPPKPPSDTMSDMEIVCGIIGLPIRKLIKYGREEPTYTLVMESGETVYLGTIDILLSQPKFRGRIAAQLDVLIDRKMKAKEWDTAIQCMLTNCEQLAHDEATRIDFLAAKLGLYIHDEGVHLHESRTRHAISSASPFVDDGVLHVSGANFTEFMRVHGYPVSSRREQSFLKECFRESGFVQVKIACGKTTKSYWRGPASILDHTPIGIDEESVEAGDEPPYQFPGAAHA